MPIDRDYVADRAWADDYLPAAKGIAGHLASEVACERRDRQQATDLIVLRGDEKTLAFRVRRSEPWRRSHPFDITIRAHRPGSATEAIKIFVEGWARYFIYGFGEPNLLIERWIVCDLDVIRQHRVFGPRFAELAKKDQLNPSRASGLHPNDDGTWLRAIDVRTLPRAAFPATSDCYWDDGKQRTFSTNDMVQKVLVLRETWREHARVREALPEHFRGPEDPITRELAEKWIRCMARGTASDDDVRRVMTLVESAWDVHYPDCTCAACFERRLARAEGR
jgi:hypothetical protein